MRRLTFAIAAVLACAALPASAQDSQSTPAIAPPLDTQVAPGAPSVTSPPNAESVPKAPSAAEAVPEAPKAPTSAQAVPPSRYVFNRVDAGYLRLDNQTGQVAFCSQHAVGWACQAVPEDRAALEKEIARLHDEIAGLKSEVAALREPPPPRPPVELTPPASDRSEDSKKLREDLSRARAAIENAWQRLVEMIVNFQKDMMRKG